MGEEVDLILSFAIAAGGVFFILFSLLLFQIKGKKRQLHITLAIVYFLLGFSYLCDPYYRLGTVDYTSAILYINYPLVYLTGSFFYFYVRSLLDREYKIRKGQYLLFIPAVLCFLALIPFYILPAETKRLMFPLDQQPRGYYKAVIDIMQYTMFSWNFICIILAIVLSFRKSGTSDLSKRHVCIGLFPFMLFAILLSRIELSFNVEYYKLTSFLLIALFVGIAFATIRNPGFYLKLSLKRESPRYANSQLRNVDRESIIGRIEALIAAEGIYKDPDISLSLMSSLLGINTRQLSEIINSHYNINFNNFINMYRIEEAKRLLENNPEKSIITIAMESGYNSKSTFNKAFRKNTGQTPTEFRKTRKISPE